MSQQDGQNPVAEINYAQYQVEDEAKYLGKIRQLIGKDLSEPYSIYVYRYFLYQWRELCYMVCIIICTLIVAADNVRPWMRMEKISSAWSSAN